MGPGQVNRKDYAFQRPFNEKPSIIPGCPVDRTEPSANTIELDISAMPEFVL